MRELAKNVTSLSWALSLYGARQLGRFFDPREGPAAAGSLQALTGTVVDQLGANLRQAFDTGNAVQRQILDTFLAFVPGGAAPAGSTGGTARPATTVPPAAAGTAASSTGAATRQAYLASDRTHLGYAGLPIFQADSQAGESILITYTRGTGTFSPDKRYIALDNTLYDLDGRENGRHEGVWQALFSSPADLLSQPPPPTGPMDRPVGPITAWPVSANTIAKWIHADGSSISSVGPAASHLIPLTDGSFLFLVITAQIITEGTGRYAGGRGLTQSLGATYVPRGVDLFGGSVSSFAATTLDTFRIKRVGRGGAAAVAATMEVKP